MAGRPLTYSENTLIRAREYLIACSDQEVERGSGDKTILSLKVKVPTKGGMAKWLGVSRETLYAWSSIYPEFSDIMEELSAEQEDRLINNGLSGDYNPTIAKVLLSKHGYNEKQEIDHTSQGEKIESGVITDLARQINDLYRGTSSGGNGENAGIVGSQTQNKK